MNGMWEHFLELVKFELQIRRFEQEGYKIELVVNDKRVLPNGRVLDNDDVSPIKYVVRTTKDGVSEEVELEIK